jgi:O-methyltransferase
MLQRFHSAAHRLVRFRPILGGGAYSVHLPLSTYSPWIGDGEFRAAYAMIDKSTLVDVYRCYEMWQLVTESMKAGPGDLLEVGVWRGGTGALTAMRSRIDRATDTVYLCDTFCGVPKAGAADPFYKGKEHADTSRVLVEKLIDSLSLKNVRVCQGIFPDETGGQLASRQFRFCHIDVDVYESAKHVLEWVWGRLLPGGIVVFDDYGFHNCSGVTRLVNEQRSRRDAVFIYNLNGHAILVKTNSPA